MEKITIFGFESLVEKNNVQYYKEFKFWQICSGKISYNGVLQLPIYNYLFYIEKFKQLTLEIAPYTAFINLIKFEQNGNKNFDSSDWFLARNLYPDLNQFFN